MYMLLHVYISICTVHIYPYISLSLSLSLSLYPSLSLYICIYIYIHTHIMYVFIVVIVCVGLLSLSFVSMLRSYRGNIQNAVSRSWEKTGTLATASEYPCSHVPAGIRTNTLCNFTLHLLPSISSHMSGNAAAPERPTAKKTRMQTNVDTSARKR